DAVGNALELKEAIACLHGGGPADLREHCLTLAGYMLRLAGQGKKWTDDKEIRALLIDQLNNGQAFAKFRQLVIGQGGDVSMVDDPSLLPKAPIVETVTAVRGGYVSQAAAEEIAIASFELGAGREKKGDSIDFGVGLEVHVKVGDKVEVGTPLVTIH